jgi:hypothetical protein
MGMLRGVTVDRVERGTRGCDRRGRGGAMKTDKIEVGETITDQR